MKLLIKSHNKIFVYDILIIWVGIPVFMTSRFDRPMVIVENIMTSHDQPSDMTHHYLIESYIFYSI